MAKLLIEKDADDNVTDINGNTPFHLSAIFGEITFTSFTPKMTWFYSLLLFNESITLSNIT